MLDRYKTLPFSLDFIHLILWQLLRLFNENTILLYLQNAHWGKEYHSIKDTNKRCSWNSQNCSSRNRFL